MKIDGVELLRMIKNNELKYGFKIKNIKTGTIYVYYKGAALWRIEENKELEEVCISELAISEFEIIEESEPIDIQAIEEIIFKREVNDNEMYLGDKIDELIKAVKHLDKNKEDK